jgi:predicted amidohydrolase
MQFAWYPRDVAVVRAIGAAQTIPVRGDIDTNLEQHVRLVHAVADERVDVLVFPELSLTGYELGLAGALAFAEHDGRLAPLIHAAAATATILIVGAPVRIGPALHIGAFIISPNGAVDVHTKHRLGAFSGDVNPGRPVPPPEDTVFSAGSRRPLVHFRGNVAAIGVCAESLRESHPKQAAERGANTYLTSHFGIPFDVEFRAAVLRGHAARHSMAVVFANYGGETGGLPGGGRSAVWSESGEPLAALGANGAGVVIARQCETSWQAKTITLGNAGISREHVPSI